MKDEIISVDSGRRGIKHCIYDAQTNTFIKKQFKNQYAEIDFEYTKTIQVLNWDDNEHLIVSIDGDKPRAYGDVCNKLYPPDRISYVTENKIYIEYSIEYTLISVARFLKEGKEYNVNVGLNLTAASMAEREYIKSKIKGRHEAIFYTNTGKVIKEVNFTIDKVGIFYQGWVSIMNLAIDENNDFRLRKEIVDNDSLMLDMGRKSLDGLLIHELSPIKIMDYDLGMERFYKYIRETLQRAPYKINQNTHQIEEVIINGKGIRGIENEAFENIIKESMIIVGNEIKNSVNEDFSSSNYNYQDIYFTGGGTFLFSDIMTQLYTDSITKKCDIKIMDDPIFTNVIGLEKMMIRHFLYEKKGM